MAKNIKRIADSLGAQVIGQVPDIGEGRRAIFLWQV
jgi:hypothetical protein